MSRVKKRRSRCPSLLSEHRSTRKLGAHALPDELTHPLDFPGRQGALRGVSISVASVARVRCIGGIRAGIRTGIRRAAGIRTGINTVLVASGFPFIRAGFARTGITGIISGDFSEGYDG